MAANCNQTLSDLILEHPKTFLQIALLITVFIWSSATEVFAVLVFLLAIKSFDIKPLWVFLAGLVLFVVGVITSYFLLWLPAHGHLTLKNFILEHFAFNHDFYKQTFNGEFINALIYIFRVDWWFILSFGVLMGGLHGLINLISTHKHGREIRNIGKGRRNKKNEKTEKQVSAALQNMDEDSFDGVFLGASIKTTKPIVITEKMLNQVLLVLGTTGSGKTVTLRRFYEYAIRQGYPLIIVDGKPTDENINWVQALAKEYGRKFYGFNCGNYINYNPLKTGGYTELKDKIISLKDEWSSDHYKSIAEDYLQTTLKVLLGAGVKLDLSNVVDYLTFEKLAVLVRSLKDKKLMSHVSTLENYDTKDITGLQAHLNILVNSELGRYFSSEDAFDLSAVLTENAVVYFALPALVFPSFSKVLGKLVINDIKTVIARQSEAAAKKVFNIFDEFSVFAGEQVINLVNMGRSKGVHAVFGTQGLADLKKVDISFMEQVLNCANTVVCHRLNDSESAEIMANTIGTKDVFDVTAQVKTDISAGTTGLGSVRRVKSFHVHPDEIKQSLSTGEAFFVSKVGGFQVDKIKVKYNYGDLLC